MTRRNGPEIERLEIYTQLAQSQEGDFPELDEKLKFLRAFTRGLDSRHNEVLFHDSDQNLCGQIVYSNNPSLHSESKPPPANYDI